MGDDRAEVLRRNIALYRGYLANGVEAEVAARYLREIKRLEAELARITKNDPKP